MENSTNINSFIGSLPRIRRRKIWEVWMDGQFVQCVSATNNRIETAEAYIAEKYPNRKFTLRFLEWRL